MSKKSEKNRGFLGCLGGVGTSILCLFKLDKNKVENVAFEWLAPPRLQPPAAIGFAR